VEVATTPAAFSMPTRRKRERKRERKKIILPARCG
jgi:hypothetical protein